MGKQIRLCQENSKTDKALLKALRVSVCEYDKYMNHKVLYIYRSKQIDAPYKDYEVYFGKENFIHLVGFKKGKVGATDFYDKCKNGTLRLGDVEFKENRKATSAKLDAIQELLDFRHCKIYKMGEANLITEKNEFEVGLGNNLGILGFDKRKSPPALPIPVTVMKRPITDYAANPENVLAILMKEANSKYYDTIIGCVSQGLLLEDLPRHIQRKISIDLYPRIIKK